MVLETVLNSQKTWGEGLVDKIEHTWNKNLDDRSVQFLEEKIPRLTPSSVSKSFWVSLLKNPFPDCSLLEYVLSAQLIETKMSVT